MNDLALLLIKLTTNFYTSHTIINHPTYVDNTALHQLWGWKDTYMLLSLDKEPPINKLKSEIIYSNISITKFTTDALLNAQKSKK